MSKEIITAPIGPKTVTVLGSHWPESYRWDGFDFTRAELRSGSIWSNYDYHLGVPWMHPDDILRYGRDDEVIYRIRLKRGWNSFVKIDGEWMVSKEPRSDSPPFGRPPSKQFRTIEVKEK